MNAEVFQGKLPSDLQISWNVHLKTTAGLTHYSRQAVAGSSPRQGSAHQMLHSFAMRPWHACSQASYQHAVVVQLDSKGVLSAKLSDHETMSASCPAVLWLLLKWQ